MGKQALLDQGRCLEDGTASWTLAQVAALEFYTLTWIRMLSNLSSRQGCQRDVVSSLMFIICYSPWTTEGPYMLIPGSFFRLLESVRGGRWRQSPQRI